EELVWTIRQIAPCECGNRINHLTKFGLRLLDFIKRISESLLCEFSILDVESRHIPSIDFSLSIEQRVVADQEPAIFAVLAERALLIFEWHGSKQRVASLLTQPLYILRVEKTSTIVLSLHIFRRDAVVIQHSLIHVQHRSVGAQYMNQCGYQVSNQAQIVLVE